MFNRVKSKARKIKESMRFFFVKLRIDEKYYTQLLQDANMWFLISGAITLKQKEEIVDVKGREGMVLMQFTTSMTNIVEIDANKIRKTFFKGCAPVKVIITENEM